MSSASARRLLLFPTPPDRLVDERDRPYFLWDVEDVDLAGFRARIHTGEDHIRAYWIAKLMRQAKPDDVFSFVSPREVGALWGGIERHLGQSRPFWVWLLLRWKVDGIR
jgi:hypothetical protein